MQVLLVVREYYILVSAVGDRWVTSLEAESTPWMERKPGMQHTKLEQYRRTLLTGAGFEQHAILYERKFIQSKPQVKGLLLLWVKA